MKTTSASVARSATFNRLAIVGLVLCVAANGCGRKKGAPITVLKQRIVKTDIEDHPNFYRLLGVAAAGGSLPGLPGGGLAGISSGGGDPTGVIAVKDDPNGDAIVLSIRLSEKFISDSNSGSNLLTHISSPDIQLRTADETNNAILLITGSLQKEGKGTSESVNLKGVKIKRTGDKFEVETDGVGNLPDDKNYVRALLSERLAKVQPPTLENNVWLGALESKEHAGWETSEILCLIKLPKNRQNLKLVVFNDAEKAVELKLDGK